MRERAELAKKNAGKSVSANEPLEENAVDTVRADSAKASAVSTETEKEQPKEAVKPAARSTQAKKRG